jgi:hypothetical protein
VASRCELQKVESVNIGNINTRQVADGLVGGLLAVGVDKERTTSHHISAVAGLALAGSDLLAVLCSLYILCNAELLEGGSGLLGLGDTLQARDNQWDLWEVRHAVASCLDERRDCGGGEGGNQGISALVHVDVSVPSAPDLGWGEHATLSAHVTECTLAASVRTTAGNSGNTCNGSAGAPRLCRGLLTSMLGDSVGLAVVLGDVGVHKVHDVASDWCSQDGWQGYCRQGKIGKVNTIYRGRYARRNASFKQGVRLFKNAAAGHVAMQS